MSFRKLRALVIEDEALARQELVAALNETQEFEVDGQADSLEDAFCLVKNKPAEVLFLDIQLLGGTAFQLLTQLKREGVAVPSVVICTGFREFEVAQRLHNEFGAEVVSILKKPFYEDWERHQERIVEAVYLRQQQERLAGRGPLSQKLLTIMDGRQSYLVNPSDVVMVRTGAKGQGKTDVVFEKNTLHCNLSLSQMLARLPSDFVQINRYEAVNLTWISLIDHAEKEVRLRSGETCLIGGNFYAVLRGLLER